MKKLPLILVSIFVTLFATTQMVSAQSAPSWFITGAGDHYLKPVSSLFGLMVPGLATTTTGCLSVATGGWISASGSACGSGGGSSAYEIATTSSITAPGFTYFTKTSGMTTLGSISTSTLSQYLFPNTSYGASTSTVLGFLGGLFSTASSTFSSSLYLPSLSQGVLYTGTNSLVNRVATSSLATNGTSITNTGTMGALVGGTAATISLNLGNANTWTVNQTFNYSSSTVYSSFLTSSSTFDRIGTLTFGGVTASTWPAFCATITGSADLCDGDDATGAGGSSAYEIATTSDITLSGYAYFTKTSGRTTLGSVSTSTLANWILPFTSYGASTSTTLGLLGGYFSTASSTQSGNFFLPALTQGILYTGTNGKVGTVATSSFALSQFTNDLANLTALDTSLTFSGAYNGATARTVGLNVDRTNTWSVLQNFNYSSSTLYSSFVRASTTALHVGSGQGYGFIGSNGLFGVISSSTLATNMQLNCATITGSADLCDGNDASGVGGSSAATSTVDYVVYNRTNYSTYVYDTRSGADVYSAGTFDGAMNYIINAATSTVPARSNVKVRNGQYACNSPIILSGRNTRFTNHFNIEGGYGTTTSIIINTPACFNFRDQAEVSLLGLAADFQGNSNDFAIASSSAGTIQTSVQNSTFNNIGFSTTTGHTGHMYDFIDDFRNNFIGQGTVCDQCGNFFRTTNNYTNAQFINGDTNFIGFHFVELNNAGAGVGWDIQGEKGLVNQMRLDDINGISNDAAGSANDILLRIGGTIGGSRITADGLNAEQFATTTQITVGRFNKIRSHKYITPTNSDTKVAIFETGANATDNTFVCAADIELSAAATLFYDLNTSRTRHNTFTGENGTNCYIADNGGSARWATSTASVVRDVFNDISGETWLGRIKILGDKIAFAWSESIDTTLGYFGSALRTIVSGSEEQTITSTGYTGFSTTTPGGAVVSISSTTQPQLRLVGGTTDAGWTFRGIGGSFYIATSSNTGAYATSSRFALAIDSNNLVSVHNLALSTTSAGCAAIMSTGLLVSTGSACGSGGGLSSYDAWTHPQVGFSATTSAVVISTSTAPTNIAALTIASTTASQIALSASLGNPMWVLRNAGGNLYIATTTVVGTATTTTAALTLASSGFGIAAGTTTASATYAFNTVAGQDAWAVGSSTGEYLRINATGQIFVPQIAASSGTPNSACFVATTNQLTENAALTCTVSSRLQKNDQGYLYGDYLTTLLELKPVQFSYKDQPNRSRWGFYAEDVRDVDPKLADGYDKNGNPQSLDQNAILALTVKAVQELAQAKGVAKGATDNWQNIFIGLLVLYVVYNEYDKRKKK